MTETLHLFWIALAALMALRLYSSGRLWRAISLGLIWGAAGLTRPEATLVLTPLLLPILVARHIRVPTRLSLCATAVLGKIAVMAPWVARNYVVYGTFVLHVPVGGLALFSGTYPYPPRFGMHGTLPEPSLITETREYREITGPFWDPEYLPQAPGRENRMKRNVVEGMPVPSPDPAIVVVRNERDMLEVDRRLTAAALTNIKNNKLIQLYNIPRHFHALWGHPAAWWGVDPPGPFALAWFGSYLAFLTLFVLGVLVAWKSGKLGVVPLSWLILIAGHTGVLLLLHSEARFQATPAIFLYIFSGLRAAAILPFPALAPTAAGFSLVGRRRIESRLRK